MGGVTGKALGIGGSAELEELKNELGQPAHKWSQDFVLQLDKLVSKAFQVLDRKPVARTTHMSVSDWLQRCSKVLTRSKCESGDADDAVLYSLLVDALRPDAQSMWDLAIEVNRRTTQAERGKAADYNPTSNDGSAVREISVATVLLDTILAAGIVDSADHASLHGLTAEQLAQKIIDANIDASILDDGVSKAAVELAAQIAAGDKSAASKLLDKANLAVPADAGARRWRKPKSGAPKIETEQEREAQLSLATAMYRAAMEKLNTAEYNEALKLLDKVLGIRKQCMAESAKDIGVVWARMGDANWGLSKSHKTIKSYRKIHECYHNALVVLEQSTTAGDTEVMRLQCRLAGILLAMHSYTDVPELLEKLVQTFDNHELDVPQTKLGKTLHRLAKAYHALGRHNDAVKVLERMLSLLDGTAHDGVSYGNASGAASAEPLIDLAESFIALGNTSKPAELIKRASKIVLDVHGQSHTLHARCLSTLGQISIKRQDYISAANMLEQAIAVLEPLVPDGKTKRSLGQAAMGDGLRAVGYRLWATGYGLWATGCGLWAVGYGLGARGYRLGADGKTKRSMGQTIFDPS